MSSVCAARGGPDPLHPGIIAAGEWSLAINDCGKWVSQSTTIKYEQKFGAGACDVWDDYENWTPDVVQGMTSLWRAQADALGVRPAASRYHG